jgi:GT2 family glycosyltransferase
MPVNETRLGMNNPIITAIVLNWNGREYVEEAVSSLLEQSYPNLEIIIVDNGSTDGSRRLIEDRFGTKIKLITKQRNTGFADGNNTGIREAKGKYILILNNDAAAEKDWASELVKAAEKYPDVGMCASKVLDYFDRQVIDTAGHLIYRDGLNRARGRLEKDEGQYDNPGEVFFPSGAAALYRKEMLDEIGLFDEDFFAYGEDADIGIRGRLAGWKCLYVPAAVAYHRYSRSTSGYSPLKVFLVERNRAWVALKNFPVSLCLLNPFYAAKRYLWQAYGAMFRKGAAGRFAEKYSKQRLLWILVKANASAVAGASRMCGKRRQVKKITKVSGQEIASWFDKYGITVKELALKD